MVHFLIVFLACITQSVSFFFPYVGHHTVCVCGHHQCYLLFQLLLVIYLPCILRCSKTELDSCLDVLCKANKFDDLHLRGDATALRCMLVVLTTLTCQVVNIIFGVDNFTQSDNTK